MEASLRNAFKGEFVRYPKPHCEQIFGQLHTHNGTKREKITILKKLIVFFKQQQQQLNPYKTVKTCYFLFNSYPVDTAGTTPFNGVMGMSRRTSKSPSNSRPQSPARAQKRKLDEREPGEIIHSPRESTDVYPSKRQTREDAENISGI